MRYYNKKDSSIKSIGGFTLIELLVVIAIIGLLSTLAVVAVNRGREKTKLAKAVHDINQIRKAIDMMAIDTGYWPSHQQLDIVCTDLPGGCPANNEVCDDGCAHNIDSGQAGIVATDGLYFGWAGPYMDSVPLDPWGNQYFFDTDYTYNGDTVVVVGSYGPNGEGLNQYDEDDIIEILYK